MQFKWNNCGFSAKTIQPVCSGALPAVKQLRGLCKDFTYSNQASSVALPFDTAFAKQSKQLAAKFKHVKLVIVVGIGGSNLGSQAVFEAVNGKHYNLFSKKKLLWADSIDADSLIAAKKAMAATTPAETLLIVISKSGSTIESIVNFQVLFKKGVNVVAISEAGSKLHNLALSMGFEFLPMPNKVSGRYSVFSNVGLFPLAVMGLDIDNFLKGGRRATSASLSLNWRKNPALVMAALLYLHHKRGKNINENFFFAANLESLGKWYRQLLAESTGKEKNLQGKKVNEGITPVVATAVDLHSQAQLYFGGQNNRFYTLVEVGLENGVSIPPLKQGAQIVPEIGQKKTNEVVSAIANGFKQTLVGYKRPFVEITLSELSEEEIGYYLQIHMIATVLLCHLLNVNAFDQPSVEAYKKETKKQLTRVSKHY